MHISFFPLTAAPFPNIRPTWTIWPYSPPLSYICGKVRFGANRSSRRGDGNKDIHDRGPKEEEGEESN